MGFNSVFKGLTKQSIKLPDDGLLTETCRSTLM